MAGGRCVPEDQLAGGGPGLAIEDATKNYGMSIIINVFSLKTALSAGMGGVLGAQAGPFGSAALAIAGGAAALAKTIQAADSDRARTNQANPVGSYLVTMRKELDLPKLSKLSVS